MRPPYTVGVQQTAPNRSHAISTLDDLKSWMTAAIEAYTDRIGDYESDRIAGRSYVARSIRFDEANGLVQTANAPGYFGGVWSLATCKKMMRGEPREGNDPNPSHPFRQLFADDDGPGLRPRRPVFIISCASSDQSLDIPYWADSGREWVASVALVTRGFLGMDEYETYLRDRYDCIAYDYRVTGRSDAPTIARKKGDCHVDDAGDVCFPPEEHDHDFEEAGDFSGGGCTVRATDEPEPEDYIDNSRSHVKCIADRGFWIGWSTPTFATKPDTNIGQSNPKIRGWDSIDARFEAVR